MKRFVLLLALLTFSVFAFTPTDAKASQTKFYSDVGITVPAHITVQADYTIDNVNQFESVVYAINYKQLTTQAIAIITDKPVTGGTLQNLKYLYKIVPVVKRIFFRSDKNCFIWSWQKRK